MRTFNFLLPSASQKRLCISSLEPVYFEKQRFSPIRELDRVPSLIDAEYQDRYYDKENFNGVTTKSADYFTVKKGLWSTTIPFYPEIFCVLREQHNKYLFPRRIRMTFIETIFTASCNSFQDKQQQMQSTSFEQVITERESSV